MKLIEAMNELKLTDKKLRQKTEFIRRYAARPNFKDDVFEKDGGQAKKVGEAMQSAHDLLKRHEDLKRAIDFTNLMTPVGVSLGTGKGAKMSIHALIQHKRTLCALKKSIYQSLDDRAAH